MTQKLTTSEKRLVDDFIKSASKTHTSPMFSWFYSGIISLLGLILFAAAVLITLNNFSERVVYWVFLPGTIGGLGMILFGFFLLKYLKRVEERKKLASVIEKLLK